MKASWAVLVIVLFLGIAGSVQEVVAEISITTEENVLSIDKSNPTLRKINPDTGATISSVTITQDGSFPADRPIVNGGGGLAFNPADEKLYALLKLSPSGGGSGSGAADRTLVTIDPRTGIATFIGNTGDKFAALAFTSGTLFAATTPDANVENTLFRMSTVNASTTNLCELASNSGLSLAFNPSDGFLYHYSRTNSNFDRIDDTSTGAGNPCGVTNIPTTASGQFSTGLVFSQARGVFLMSEDGTNLFTLSAAGQGPDLISTIDAQPRGLAIITPSSGSGGSANMHKTRPTFGLDHNTFQPWVEGGFRFNGITHDITDNYWTPFDEQEVRVGAINSFSAKVYSDKGLRTQEFLFGIPEVGKAQDAKVVVEVWYDRQQNIVGTNVSQERNVVDPDSLTASHHVADCSSQNNLQCDVTRISIKFLEPLEDKVSAIRAVDHQNRVQLTYQNEGFDITGDSLNPPDIMMVAFGTKDMRGLYELTRTDPISDIWVDESGNIYQDNGNSNFVQTSKVELITVDDYLSMQGYDRNDASFVVTNQAQLELVSEMMHAYYRTSINSEKSFSEINDIFVYEFPETGDRASDLLMQQEISKANIILGQLCPECGDESFDKLYDTVFFVNIPADDALVQEILQQEFNIALDKFNQRYGHIYKHDYYVVESFGTISEDTSDVDMKEKSQMEISKALKIFERYGNVYR